MRKGAEDSTGAVASLLHVVALGRLVDLGMELLLGTRVTVRTRVALLAVAGLAPFLAVLHVRAWRRSVSINVRCINKSHLKELPLLLLNVPQTVLNSPTFAFFIAKKKKKKLKSIHAYRKLPISCVAHHYITQLELIRDDARL